MNILKISLFTLILSLFVAGTAQASGTSCSSFYGGGYTGSQSCAKITVDKKVLKPGSKDYVDALSGNDAKYGVNQEVKFQITVQNVGQEKLTDITLVDTLPQYLQYASGPQGIIIEGSKLTVKVPSLEVGQSQIFVITAKVADQVAVSDKGFVCVTNFVRATEKRGIFAEDSAQLCIEQTLKVHPPVLGVKQTPPTGPADAALAILASMAGAGLYLTRQTQFMITKKRGGVTK
jgi:uncharacterized repeat protein (TIGR01451 family)